MKKMLCSVLAVIMLLLMPMTSLAQEQMWGIPIREVSASAQYAGNNAARIQATPRGRLLSSVEVRATKVSGSVIEIHAEAFCHTAMGKIKMSLTLEKLDESTNSWDRMDRQEFEWNAADLEEGEELTTAIVTYTVSGMPSSDTYRVRGIFAAYELNGDTQEGWSSKTEAF